MNNVAPKCTVADKILFQEQWTWEWLEAYHLNNENNESPGEVAGNFGPHTNVYQAGVVCLLIRILPAPVADCRETYDLNFSRQWQLL